MRRNNKKIIKKMSKVVFEQAGWIVEKLSCPKYSYLITNLKKNFIKYSTINNEEKILEPLYKIIAMDTERELKENA